VDQSKTVEVRKSYEIFTIPYGSPISLVFPENKFYPEILGGSPRAGALNEGGVGKIGDFRPLSRHNISERVQDRTNVGTKINDIE